MQRMKGQANNQASNGPKEHQAQQQQHGDHGDETNFESWRGGNNTQHHTNYPIGTGEAYPYYAGTSFPYQTFGAGDGTWSNGTESVAFLSGYGGQISHDAYGMDQMFPTGAGGSFGGFGQPTFNYFPGNGDFNAWGTPRKTRYEDYYPQPRGNENYQGATSAGGEIKTIDQGVQGLTIGEVPRHDQNISSGQGNKSEQKEQRKITWASVASQPAKPIPPAPVNQGMKKKAGMPPPPIVPGKHNMDIGTWGEGKSSSAPPPPPKVPLPQQIQPAIPVPPPTIQRQRPPPPPSWKHPESPPSPNQNIPQQQSQVQVQVKVQVPIQMQMPQGQQSQTIHHQTVEDHQHVSTQPQTHHTSNPTIQNHHHNQNQLQQQPSQYQQQQSLTPTQAIDSPVLDELKVKNKYNPSDFDQSAPGAKFFVIKSYSEDDIHRSIKYEIWCSTEHGNKRLDQAYRDASRESAPLYLFFSVNGSGHFCGMAQMVSSVDYQSNSSVWSQDKWKGQFRVRWIYVKDVPNVQLRHIRLENNENKPVTNSRDAQEVPHARGIQVLRILHSYRHSTSIFDDFGHYEKRQAEEDQRKVPLPIQRHQQYSPPPNHGHRARPHPPGDVNREHPHHQAHHHHHHHHQRREPFGFQERDGRGRGRGGGAPR